MSIDITLQDYWSFLNTQKLFYDIFQNLHPWLIGINLLIYKLVKIIEVFDRQTLYSFQLILQLLSQAASTNQFLLLYLEEAYISKIASLIINQKNISLSFPKNSYNNDPYNEVEYFSNGLRIFENLNEYEKRSNGRMIVTNTSINMARLGLKYLNNKNISNFYEELDQLLDVAKNEMLLVFETMGNKNKENYQVLFNGNVYGDDRLLPGQKIRKIIKAGVLNVGLVGLKECVLCFEQDPTKQYSFLLEVLEYLNKKMKQFSEETKLYFSIFEPSEEKARKYLIGIDKSIYGSHKNITDKGLYDLIETASFIPDNKSLGQVQRLLNGGNLITMDISNKTNNKKVVDLIKELVNDDIGFVKMKVGK